MTRVTKASLFLLVLASSCFAGVARADDGAFGDFGVELGATLYHATRVRPSTSSDTVSGIDGFRGDARVSDVFDIVPGFALGPYASVGVGSTHETTSACCDVHRTLGTFSVGIEGDYHPTPGRGFHVRASFGYAQAALTDLALFSGMRWSVAMVRDFRVSPRVRLGGFLRIDVDALHTTSGEVPSHLVSLVPSVGLAASFR